MIWVDGKILPDDGLAINAADRTFEHGLGLFETLRTWGGRATLLDRHKARMLRSAEELRIPIDPARFPDDEAVRTLLLAGGTEEDQMLRITATGGSQSVSEERWSEGKGTGSESSRCPPPFPAADVRSVDHGDRHLEDSEPVPVIDSAFPSGTPSQKGSVVWMRSKPLGKSSGRESIRVALDSWTIRHDDPLARHKSLNFWARRLAVESALLRGYSETLGLSDEGDYCEGGWSNLFVILGDQLMTPSLDAPIIPGVMRRLVLDLAEGLPLVVREVPGIPARQLGEAAEVFLTNSVRGIMPVALAEGSGHRHDWPAPGPWTGRLQALLGRGVTP